MKLNPKVTYLVRKAAKISYEDRMVWFEYRKDDGSISKRNVRVGIDVAAKFEREGNPLKGVGNWASGTKRKGKNNCIILRGGEAYLQGTDKKDKAFKYFKLSGISNLR